MYENRKQPLLSTAKFLKRVVRHWLAGFGVLAFGLGGGILGYHYIAGLELDRFAVKRVDDPWRNGPSRSVADEWRENFCVVLRTVFRAGVYCHRVGVACTICSSPATSRSCRGARTMRFAEVFHE